MKKTIIGLLALLVLGTLYGCKGKTAELDAAGLSDYLYQNAEFETTLTLLNSDQAEILYPGIEELCEKIYIYESDTLEIELLAVVSCSDPAKAAELFKERQSYLLHQAENYFPEQTQRIENAVIQQLENGVVFIINDHPEEAKSLIESWK